MAEPKQATRGNFAALGSLAAIFAVFLLLLIGTKLVKFVQFFITKRHFERLSFKIEPDETSDPEEQAYEGKAVVTEGDSSHVTPRRQPLPKRHRVELLTYQSDKACESVASRLKSHAGQLMQFFAPLPALLQLVSCSKTAILPAYVILGQLMARALVLVTLTVACSIAFMKLTLSDKQAKCFMDRTATSGAYHCLNELEDSQPDLASKLPLLGMACALLAFAAMYTISWVLFRQFTRYLSQIVGSGHQQPPLAATDEENQTVYKNEVTQEEKASKLLLSTGGSRPLKKSRKSPTKRKYDSVSSFRALLERGTDSDSSVAHHLNIPDAGYDSGAQMSMSTQANLLNQSSNIGGVLNLSSQAHSARDSASAPGAGTANQNGAKKGQNPKESLLPIDEDLDDEKCSPIKPKRRTSEDSPFKRITEEAAALQNGFNEGGPISSVSSRGLRMRDNISVGGFGIELDNQMAGDHQADSSNQFTINLNSGLGSPQRQRNMSSPTDQKQGSPLRSMSSRKGQRCTNFELKVEQIDADADRIILGSSEQQQKAVDYSGGTLAVGGEKQAGVTGQSRNQPSIIHVNSYSALDESTLQLDSIGATKPNLPPKSTKNAVAPKIHGAKHSAFSGMTFDQMRSVKRRGSNREDTVGAGIHMGMITPFSYNQGSSANEVATEDKLSLSVANRNAAAIEEAEDSVALSEVLSNCMRQNSPSKRGKLTTSARLLKEFKVEAPATDSARRPLFKAVKKALLVTLGIALAFTICFDAFSVYYMTSQAASLVSRTLAVAFVADLALQLVTLLAMSCLQSRAQIKGTSLPFDTSKLSHLTFEARKLAQKIFKDYEEQSALLRVDFQDQDDIMIEQLERDLHKIDKRDHSDENSSQALSQQADQISPQDLLVKEAVRRVTVAGISCRVTETLRFKPPRSTVERDVGKVNLIKPGLLDPVRESGLAVHQPENDLFGEQEISDQEVKELVEHRRQKLVTKQYERTFKFFAEQKPNAVRKRLRGSKLSSTKKSATATLLKQSIEQIEMDKLESDFPSCQGSRSALQIAQSKTPDKKLPPSSIKKNSHFLTPKAATLSQVKLKQAKDQATDKPNEPQPSVSEKKDEVCRRLTLKHQSVGSAAESRELVSRLDSVKKYAEDDRDEENGMGLAMILSNSSKSFFGIDSAPKVAVVAIEAPQTSSIELQRLNVDSCDNIADFEKQMQKEMDEEEVDQQLGSFDHTLKEEKYSPIFSSVNRQRKIGPLDSVKPSLDSSHQAFESRIVSGAQGFTSNDKIECHATYTRHPTREADLQALSGSTSKDNATKSPFTSNNAILSHREMLSKQKSFNSPRSLHERLQLTNDKIQKSIDGSSVNKGRRNMVLLDEAAVSKQSLNFGPAEAGSALVTSQMGSALVNGGISMEDSQESVTRVFLRATESKTQAAYNAAAALNGSQVLFEDQGLPDLQQEQEILGTEDCEETFFVSREEIADVVKNLPLDDEDLMPYTLARPSDYQDEILIVKPDSELDSVPTSGVQSKTGHQTKQRSSQSGENSTEKTAAGVPDVKSSTTTSAFQRLVMASKRMIQRKSSEKKDPMWSKLQVQMAARSNSQCGADTISIMREQTNNLNSAIYAPPTRLGSKQQARARSNPPIDLSTKKEEGGTKVAQEKAVLPTKHTIAGLTALDQRNKDSTFRLPGESDNDHMSEVLEQSSLEAETPMVNQKRQKGSLPPGSNQGSSSRIQDTTPSQYAVPPSFNKEQVNPVKSFNVGIITVDQVSSEPSKKLQQKRSRASLRSRVTSRDEPTVGQGDEPMASMGSGNDSRNDKYEVYRRTSKGFKQRKNSQMTSKSGQGGQGQGNKLLNGPRRNSKISHNRLKNGGCQTNEKRSQHKKHNSSRENTVSSMSIDFDRMERHNREEDYSEYSKMVSQGSFMSRLEDQRRRLESFLSLAQQAKSRRDIAKIQEMIRQIDETNRPLPMSRINELKLLELMASPYNQSLIAMIKVELDISRKLKEAKRAQANVIAIQQQKEGNTKSKFSLPKHLTTQNSKICVHDDDRQDLASSNFLQQFKISNPATTNNKQQKSENRLTTVVNIKPGVGGGITSCRSNNDVAPRRGFTRSPQSSQKHHQHQQASPLSHMITQPPVLSGKREGSSVSGRYSYLRNVGSVVVQQEDVRKSVDRIRMGGNNGRDGSNLKSRSELLEISRFEEAGRRATAPIDADNYHRKPNLMFNFAAAAATGGGSYSNNETPVLSAQGLGNGPCSKAELMGAEKQQERSTTSYGMQNQQFGALIGGQEGFIKRIQPPIGSKSALDRIDNKENAQNGVGKDRV